MNEPVTADADAEPRDELPDVGNEGVPEVNTAPGSGRGYLALGELLDALRTEFPDLTVSKIRFLEENGLLEPERTLSGYRKFYPRHVERLRWVLDQQRDTYLPLRELRERLAEAEKAGQFEVDRTERVPSLAARPERVRGSAVDRSDSLSRGARHATQSDGDDRGVSDGSLRDAPPEALGERRHPSSVATRVQAAFASAHASLAPIPSAQTTVAPRPSAIDTPGAASAAGVAPLADSPDEEERGAAGLSQLPDASPPSDSTEPRAGVVTGLSLTFDELVRASGVTPDELRQLEQFGIVISRSVMSARYYDEDALVAARTAATLRSFGVEARHLRMYRTAADREAEFYTQIVSPLVFRRQESAQQQAIANLNELQQLGGRLREVILRQVVRATLDAR